MSAIASSARGKTAAADRLGLLLAKERMDTAPLGTVAFRR
jgi:hypothetical protein